MPNLKNKKVIKDQQGQRKYPGRVTEIQGNTMATTGYGDIPLYVVPNVGNPMVVPANSGNRVFPGASRFTEYPIAKNGGWLEKYQDGGYKSQEEYESHLLDPYTKEKRQSQLKWINSQLEATKALNDIKNRRKVKDYDIPENTPANVRQYAEISPTGYTDLGNYIRYATGNSRPDMDKPKTTLADEEAWMKYNNIPHENKSIIPSTYKPSTSKNINTIYHKFDNVTDSLMFNDIENKLKDKPYGNIQVGEMEMYNGPTTETGYNMYSPLGNFTIGKGKDEKGDYLSYYDKYDFDSAPKFVQNRLPGNEFEFYNRRYLKPKLSVWDKALLKNKKIVPKKEMGGWLDTYEDGGETDPPVNLRSASTQLASPVSTQAPEVPLNKTGWDWVKQKYENRQPSEWNMLMMDKSGSYVDSGVDPFSLMLTAPQQVIKAGVKGGKALLDASKSNKIKQVIHEDVKLVSNAKRSQELDGEAFSIYKGNKNVGEISGKRLSNGDFEVSDIGVDSQFQKQGIGTQVYKQLNQSLEPGNKVKSWGAFVENNGIAPGKSTWQSLEKQGLAKLNKKGTYEMLPKELPSSSNKFKSEIDWENWVKYKEDFYDNPELIQHLNEIEKTSKANRTWMKNPDGSPFQGTKEQFVVQQSDNFKKAFPNAVKDKLGNTQYNYHGSPNKLDFFDESKAKGVMYGKGVYTTSDKLLGKKYIENNPNGELYELYINSNKPQNTITNKDFFDYQNKQKKLINSAKNTNNETLKEKIYKDIKKLDDEWGIKYDENVKNQSLKEGFDFLKVDENQVTPFSNFLKSAKGNIKFDMTNPNIYKAAIPIGLGVAASQNKQDNSQWLDKYK